MPAKLGLSALAVVLGLLIVGPATATAAGVDSRTKMTGGNSSECPKGTCNMAGGTFAKDVKYCSAANCAKGKK